MILQSIVGDERDLQGVLNQKKVSAAWRQEQRNRLKDFVKLKVVERVNSPEEEGDRTSVASLNSSKKANDSTATESYSRRIESDWQEFSLDDLPM